MQDQITIAAWFNAVDWNGNRRILQKGDSDNQYRLLAESGSLKFHLSGVGELTAPLPNTGFWHHAAGVYDGSLIKIYIDGLEVASMNATGSINQTTDLLYIGTKGIGVSVAGDYFYGTIDDVRVYGSALTQAQVVSLALMGQDLLPEVDVVAVQSDLEASINHYVDLDASVFDLNEDTMAYRWTVEDPDPAVRDSVTFVPGSNIEDVRAEFSQPGTFTLRLSIDDGTVGYLHGQDIYDEVTLTVIDITCQFLYESGYGYAGDINRDCYVTLQDFAILASNWLKCSDPSYANCMSGN